VSKSNPSSFKGTKLFRPCEEKLGKLDLYSFNCVTPGHVSSVGVPKTLKKNYFNLKSLKNLKILNIWSISESPWKSGFFVTISEKMHPMLQRSTGVEYSHEPNNSSGALYHMVTTSLV